MPKPTHILVIRLSAMGDVAMTVPVLQVFAKTYPEVKLTVVSKKHFKPFFNTIPTVEFLEADVYGKHKGFGLLKLANEAKSAGIDAVADLHNVIRSKIISNYLRVRGVQTATIDKGREEKRELTASENKKFTQLKTTHQRYADVFEKLGFPLDLSQHTVPERQQLNKRLHNLIGKHTKKAIGIAPFAAHESKMYPLELMKVVISELHKTEKFKIFLFGGGKKEEELLNKLASNFTQVTNVAGQLTFEEELALISNLDGMLSMDSGNGHLAAMFGIPVITLWGVTHPFAGFVPFNQPIANQLTADREQYPLIPTSIYGNKFPEGYENVMKSIAPKTVVEAVFKVF
ncbi:glycosyltransferase family 9 protein [Marixanthomonas spongiae]|uniref:ADP-heptose--LPS heptosyltransferase RfaF n=1 Tax=Marixanthomonas spongiae TaxID=2174845 RepID=A0A2U0I1Z9_9FLAO|nr:glycosyltransferase family 9 protein [Marixanthomonas spongiae]PVW15118.1 ADP-heptose--LPS heptosyltransferase RfaF [Marixanthomonas spongiae]